MKGGELVMWPHGAAYLLLAGRPSADWPLSSLLWRSALLTTATGPRHWRDIWTSGHPDICNTYWPIGQLTKFGRFCLNYDLPHASCILCGLRDEVFIFSGVDHCTGLLGVGSHWCLDPGAGPGWAWSLRTGAIPALGPAQFLHCQLLVQRLSDLWQWLH